MSVYLHDIPLSEARARLQQALGRRWTLADFRRGDSATG
jgi:hypothetical protein